MVAVDPAILGGKNRGRFQSGFCSAGALVNTNHKRIADFAIKTKLPSVYGRREVIDEGGLMYYGADLTGSCRRVAYHVDRVLNRSDDSAERAGESGQGD